MQTLRQLFVAVVFFAVTIVTIYAVSSLAPDARSAKSAFGVADSFTLQSEGIKRTAPFVYGGALAGIGLGIGAASLANRIMKKWENNRKAARREGGTPLRSK
jgi:hypothetical protein